MCFEARPRDDAHDATGKAAIDDNLGARNIVSPLARQEHDGIGDVFRFADPPPRYQCRLLYAIRSGGRRFAIFDAIDSTFVRLLGNQVETEFLPDDTEESRAPNAAAI